MAAIVLTARHVSTSSSPQSRSASAGNPFPGPRDKKHTFQAWVMGVLPSDWSEMRSWPKLGQAEISSRSFSLEMGQRKNPLDCCVASFS